jgi:hypothetical protein
MQTLELEDVKQSLAQWRKRQKGLGRIPSQVWKMAAEVAETRGVEETALALRLDVRRLRQWMPQPSRKPDQQRPASPDFVEWPPWTPTPNNEPECTFDLDLEGPGGRRLRICLKGQATAQAVNLARLFCKEDGP